MLVSRGHDKGKLLYEYSVPEVLLFAKAAVENQKNDLVQLLVGMRVASHAKPEMFQKYIKELMHPSTSKQSKAKDKRRAVAKLRQFGLPRR